MAASIRLDSAKVEFTHLLGSHKESYTINAWQEGLSMDDFVSILVTPEELLAFTRDLAEMQGLVVVDRNEMVTLLDDAKQTLWDQKSPAISLSILLDKLRDFANNNKLVNL